MIRALRTAAIATVALTLALGVAYPLLMTGLARVAFPGASGGSLIERDGEVVGSRLIGQSFAGRPGYFQSRPSQTEYAGDATAFSNAGPSSADLRDRLAAGARRYLRRERPWSPGLTLADVPASAVMTSGSGVDPQIDPADARIQARRVAAVRGLPLGRVLDLVEESTEGRALGIIGDPGVNVLRLNLDLDQEAGR